MACYFVSVKVLHSPPLYRQVSSLLTSEVHSVRAGRHLATKLNILVQQHFDLASTTITNIPMKVRLLSSSSPKVQAFTSPIYNLSPFSLTPTHYFLQGCVPAVLS